MALLERFHQDTEREREREGPRGEFYEGKQTNKNQNKRREKLGRKRFTFLTSNERFYNDSYYTSHCRCRVSNDITGAPSY